MRENIFYYLKLHWRILFWMRIFRNGMRPGSLACFLVAFGLAVLQAPLATGASRTTALDQYVKAPDNHYRYELVREIPREGYKIFVLSMTSQEWRKPSEVDRTIWQHWVSIYKPDTVKPSTGFLIIAGGQADGKPPKLDDTLARIATTTHSVVTELRMVPNQPLTFKGDSFGPRREDESISYTWDRFLKTGDATWPMRLPMTKSAVRAMDTVTSFMGSGQGGTVKVDRFMVAGASKRGWTTWATAAVDPRVVAISPIVIDVPNVVKSFDHHYRAYGFWAPAVKDYYDMKLMDVMNTRGYKDLMNIEDPYSYRDRFTMPKFLINAAGDQFFLPDSSRFYFDDLPGEKYLRYVPNTDHSLKGSDANDSLVAFYQSIVDGTPRPKFSWKFERNGAIRVITESQPATVKLWQATNPVARDFRLESVGPIYHAMDLTPVKPGVYLAKVEKPAKGWTASFVELTYPSGGKYPFKFTTAVRVTPDKLPYPSPKPGQTRMGPEPKMAKQ